MQLSWDQIQANALNFSNAGRIHGMKNLMRRVLSVGSSPFLALTTRLMSDALRRGRSVKPVGFSVKDTTEASCVAALMERYKSTVGKKS